MQIFASFKINIMPPQWRLLPSWYGNWRAIHRRFFRWTQRGIWERLLEKAEINPDLEAVMIDAPIIRAIPVRLAMGEIAKKSKLWVVV